MNPGVSLQTGTVDYVFYFIFWISVFFLVLITGLMIYFVIKYNKKRHAKAVNIEGNTPLEIMWTVIPIIIVMVMFYVSLEGFKFLRKAPENSMKVTVNARMWSWMFEYENGVKTDTLIVPVNRPVKLLLTSQDVIHSFYVPAFRIKEDAVPGTQNHLWFQATTEGNYDVLCAEYCGLRHAYMLTKIDVIPQMDFEEWYRQEGEKVTETPVAGTKLAENRPQTSTGGKTLLKVHGCVACHSFDGSKLVGPSFKGLFGTQQVVLTGGEKRNIQVDEEYLRTAILKPNADIVEGFQALMPPQADQMTEEELTAIIQYLKEL